MIDNNAEMSARLKALEEKKKALELELARLKEERDLAIRNSPVDLTQKDYFMSYTKKELLEIAKEMNLKIASSWKKSEVAEKITNNVLMSSWLTKKNAVT